MPAFDDAIETAAPPEEVWKALYDPSRFPEWWAGVDTVQPGEEGFTLFLEGYPDFPMPQQLRTSRTDGRVTVSCMVSDLVFDWRLEENAAGGTRIGVHVEIPDAEAPRLAAQQETIAASLRRLAAVAMGGPPAPG